MTHDEARQWAAQAWCTNTTSDRVMDPPLAEAFAEILAARVNETRTAEHLRMAKMIFKNKFSADPTLRQAYRDNVAMLIHGRIGVPNRKRRNNVANEILDLIFR